MKLGYPEYGPLETDCDDIILGCLIALFTRDCGAHRALKVRAAQHNRSAEAEMRAILEAAVRPEGRLRLGTALAEMSRKIGPTNVDVEALEQGRDARAAEPMRFE